MELWTNVDYGLMWTIWTNVGCGLMWNCGLLWNCGLVLTILLSKTNISKTIRCMPMKSSQVDGMVNVCYTFVVMERNCDVIMTSSVKTIRI